MSEVGDELGLWTEKSLIENEMEVVDARKGDGKRAELVWDWEIKGFWASEWKGYLGLGMRPIFLSLIKIVPCRINRKTNPINIKTKTPKSLTKRHENGKVPLFHQFSQTFFVE